MVKDIQSLIECVTALTRFVSKATDCYAPLFKAFKGHKGGITCTVESDKAFNELKEYMSRAPLLSTPEPGDILTIYLSISATAVSLVLIRPHEGAEHPVHYVSKALQDAKAWYPVHWSNVHYRSCGRFQRSKSSRPYIKCNDCGVRFLEAQCDKTIEEWLEIELFFSPLVLFQMTHFRYGGISLGLSWAHVLGDAFAASDFFNGLGLSIKQVNPVGDHWITPINCKMETLSFPITATQLNNLQFKILGQNQIHQIPIFELISAIIWQCVAKVREGSEPKLPVCMPKDFGEGRGEGRVVNIILPEKEVFGLKSELRKNDLLLENELE
ncbi:PREDICTED: protein ECERIFERUM 1-like [Prunus mume]|uniref:Protein ECERIFERUM 1-like n=1 Tax=Prunus mume TaxID=102107 RepID=A0ABM1LI98_PRUMU|nr:PREDICTED: protein ECERIFERUM 1-like [Prunus mume]